MDFAIAGPALHDHCDLGRRRVLLLIVRGQDDWGCEKKECRDCSQNTHPYCPRRGLVLALPDPAPLESEHAPVVDQG
jgi:hypothetical protein